MIMRIKIWTFNDKIKDAFENLAEMLKQSLQSLEKNLENNKYFISVEMLVPLYDLISNHDQG